MTSRRAIIVLAFIATLAGIGTFTAWQIGPGDAVERAETAESRGDWLEVVRQAERRLTGSSPNDRAALRLKARGLAHLGRNAESRELYDRAGVESMPVQDYLLLAAGLERDGRRALAWLALEAADRINPRNADVRTAMTRLHASNGNPGIVANMTEHLASVKGGPALGELVVGLATLAKSDARDDPILDRVLLRDRASLRTIDTPTAARRFLACVSLEEGNPAEAWDRLAGINQVQSDPEAAWLMSRIYLQQGHDSEAEQALKRAGGFASDRPHLPEPAPYVGAKACHRCHSSIYDQQQNSRHATTIRHGPAMAKIPVPAGLMADPVDPKVTHAFTRDGETVKIETKVGDRTYRAVMDYAFGSGHRGMTMMGKDDSGTYREPRISHYSEHGSIWDITSGFSPHPSDPAEYLGKASRPRASATASTATRRGSARSSGATGPEAADRGIGCERCHGPGGNHVAAMDRGFGDLAIGRYKTATGPQRMTACSGCHASDGTFPPNDPQFIRFQSTTLPFSKCYTASGGKLDCVTCHDPHKTLGNLARVL